MRELIERMEGHSGGGYRTLNDAAAYDPGLSKGSTEIWYMKPGGMVDLSMGVRWCKKQDCLPDYENLKKTHVLLGKIKIKKLGRVFQALQGENWSSKGEARGLIRSKKVDHTSMMVGDIIVTKSGVYMVDKIGFYDLVTGEEVMG